MDVEQLNNTVSLLARQSFFVSLDATYNCTFINAQFKEALNPCVISIGQSLLQCLPTSAKIHWQKALDSVLQQEGEAIFDTPLAKGNETLLVSWSLQAIKFGNMVTGYEAFGRVATNDSSDLDARQRLLEQDEKLVSLVNEFNRIMDHSLDVICTFDDKGRFVRVSAACEKLWGYKPEELIGKNLSASLHADDAKRSAKATAELIKGTDVRNFENRFYRKDGTLVNATWASKWDPTVRRIYSIVRDTSEKHEREQALKSSEEKYKMLFQNHPLPMWIYDIKSMRFLEVNNAAVNHYGYSKNEFLKMNIFDIRSEKEQDRLKELHMLRGTDTLGYKGYWNHQRKDGTELYVEIIANLVFFEGRQAKLVLAADRTEHVLAEAELLKSNERYSFVRKATFDAIYDWDLKENKITWNDGILNMFNYSKEELSDDAFWWTNNLHPEDYERVTDKIDKHIYEHLPNWEDEYRFKCADGSYKHILDRAFTIYDENGKASRMIGAMQDLTERKTNELVLKELNISLEKRAKELADSNAELERFAYVASHDLQEPLRMVTSFLQLLEKRYKDQLDEKAQQYIQYAVGGADRMKLLILDLLEYSRVNITKDENEKVDLKLTLKNVKNTYANVLNEKGAVLEINPLPVVQGRATQLMQLFQNLVGNALKYSSDIPPVISVTCTTSLHFYQFEVKDNGIGIDPRFYNKIFIIFQRLHNRDQYSGTGIGLAICKKIVERHGGKIWVTSTPDKGSSFYFTLPIL